MNSLDPKAELTALLSSAAKLHNEAYALPEGEARAKKLVKRDNAVSRIQALQRLANMPVLPAREIFTTFTRFKNLRGKVERLSATKVRFRPPPGSKRWSDR